jgi:phosphoribosylglycinamide formyltransferase-1
VIAHSDLVVFTYDFPHKKTTDFVLRLFVEGIVPTLVLGAPHRTLSVPEPAFRAKPRHLDAIAPGALCDRLGVPYRVAEHNSGETHALLDAFGIRLGLIAGARILKPDTIAAVPKGIINVHPGILPSARGLDAMQWAIFEGRPLGVTAHLIDAAIDSGRVLLAREISEYCDDTFVDLSLRLEEAQNLVVGDAVRKALACAPSELPALDERHPIHSRMPKELAEKLPARLAERLSGRRGTGEI